MRGNGIGEHLESRAVRKRSRSARVTQSQIWPTVAALLGKELRQVPPDRTGPLPKVSPRARKLRHLSR